MGDVVAQFAELRRDDAPQAPVGGQAEAVVDSLAVVAVVAVEILVAHGQAVDALGEKMGDAVFDEFRFAPVVETGGEPTNGTAAGFDLAQEEGPPPSLERCPPPKSACTFREPSA